MSSRSLAAAPCSSICWPRGGWRARRCALADLNPDLIGCYRALRDDTEAVVRALSRLEARASLATATPATTTCATAASTRERAAQASGVAKEREALAESYSPALAAMLIFLNRTGFNGLFRLNRSGAFNVPAGRYAEPDASAMPATCGRWPTAFGAPGRRRSSWRRSTRRWATPGRGDFVYCDPPYAPLSRTASFCQLHRRRLHA